MRVPFMDFSFMHEPIKDTVTEKISALISKGDFILGDEVSSFEKEFANYVGTKYCIGVASGTDALTLSSNALGLKNCQIITVANTFVATVDSILTNNSKPLFVDVKENTLQINTELIEKKLNSTDVRGIIPVDLFGNMPEWSEIKDIAEKKNLRIIEDACQAHGSKYKNTLAGNFGELGCFSFYPGKNLGAFGDGGAIVTNNKNLKEKLIQLRNYGQKEKYKHELVGYNSRLDTIQAIILREKLKQLDKWIEQKRKAVKIYIEKLKDLQNIFIPHVEEHVYHSYHLFPLLVEDRGNLMNHLLTKNITTSTHYPIPIHMQKGYASLCQSEKLKNTERIAESIISLPIYPGITDKQVEYVSDTLIGFYK